MTNELITISQNTEGQLVIYEEPEVIITRATKQAKALMDIVKQQNLAMEIDGKEYLPATVWQVIAAFNGAHPQAPIIENITGHDGEISGYRVTVNLANNAGQTISSGAMTCYLTEFPCRGKKGDDKHRAALSAAQTWALSKAAKNKFAWVAVLAGYEPTPAEEMSGEETKQSAENPYWCREHKTIWFKKGKMTSFGHPIEGTEPKVWCHMPKKPETNQPAQEDSHPLASDSHKSNDETSTQSSETASSTARAETSPTDDHLVEYDALYIEAQAKGIKPLVPLSAQARLKPDQVTGAIMNLRQKLAPKEQAQ